ncbi:MAG TPA: ABC transporter permease [Actinomycetota bacterium]|nr:ABC transporter permease [Actinomycetota bacterium]
MVTFVIRRLLYLIPVLIATSLIIFTFVTVSGDPLTQVRVIPNLSQETVENIIEQNHLDRPLLVQYGYWVKEAVTDKFGTTLLGDEPIWPDLKRVLGNTLQLIVLAQILGVAFAIGVGVLSAVKQYSVFDYASTTLSFIGFSTPVFWFALILQIIFTNIYLNYDVRIFYTAQLSSPNPDNFWIDRLQHLALPVITLTVLSVAQFSRYMRASMLEVINSDYVRTARAKGLHERGVIMRHAFRNALIPLVTVVALDFGALFGGAFATETVFALDGMGLYFLRALGERDVYPLMAWLMVASLMVVLFNLIADIIYGWLDPRIRYD